MRFVKFNFLVLLFLSGLAYADDVQDVESESLDYDAGFEIGVEEALSEIESGKMTYYSFGLVIPQLPGQEQEGKFGLPQKYVAGCAVGQQTLGRIHGHNSKIEEYFGAAQ